MNGIDPELVKRGDRFRTMRDLKAHVRTVWKAPLHTGGGPAIVPRDTVLVAQDQAEGASTFRCYPEDYDGLEAVFVSDADRADPKYYAYRLSVSTTDIGNALEPLPPMDPRPPNRLPRFAPD
jgi:hypothetical protein